MGGNYVSMGGVWYNLSDTPATAATEVTAVQALPMSSWTVSAINTEVQKTDATVVVQADPEGSEGINS